MKIGIYESIEKSNRRPNLSNIRNVVVVDIAQERRRLVSWPNIFGDTNLTLIHDTDDDADATVYNEAISLMPAGGLIVRYTDNWRGIRKREVTGKLVWECRHDAIASNGRALVEKWLSDAKWHDELLLGPVDLLSSCIHALDNALFPIRNDVATLSTSTQAASEIYSEYFDEMEGGYLTGKSPQLAKMTISEYFETKVKELGLLGEDEALNKALGTFKSAIGGRTSPRIVPPGDVKEALERVLANGSAVIERLRQLRDDERGTTA